MESAPLVLVADPNDDTRDLLGMALELAGYRVAPATTGPQAYELACDLQPQLVVTVLSLPLVDGPQLLRVLRDEERTRHIPVAVVTAHAYPHKIRELKETGFAAVFVKPFTGFDVAEKVGTLLDQGSSAGCAA